MQAPPAAYRPAEAAVSPGTFLPISCLHCAQACAYESFLVCWAEAMFGGANNIANGKMMATRFKMRTICFLLWAPCRDVDFFQTREISECHPDRFRKNCT